MLGKILGGYWVLNGITPSFFTLLPKCSDYPYHFFVKSVRADLPLMRLKRIIDKRQTSAYHLAMKYLNWNLEKNELLKTQRGISFEEIALHIEAGNILGVEENPGYPDQKIYILEIDEYAYIVPFVETDNEIFLKTAFPSRKYTKRYGLKE